ncbi:MAG: hypothetical protein NUV80_02350 [Candidatus Berkelbacteria bacterium]|nr:hypothetical protein [Candidatus Berkelbacteria bacterium]MCR4307374.1 hypothetical protein [Candidatus Berkelbacteria bacterium]
MNLMNLKRMNPGWRPHLWLIGVFVVLVGVWFLIPQSQTTLVIVDGVPYQLLSYSTVESKLANGQSRRTMDAYVWTIAYPKQDQKFKGMTRGTIMVPKFAVVRDRNLPLNTVIWDGTVDLEGKKYGVARWNPAHDVPAIDNPTLDPEPAMTRTQ